MRSHRTAVLFSAGLLTLGLRAATPIHDVLYVTQVPMPEEVNDRSAINARMSCVSAMQNPLGDPLVAARGGALMIRYTDGTTRNLTAAAGYGTAQGLQGANAIAVQRPFVHWSGAKAVFSMVVGAPTSPTDNTVFHWQLHEVSNFGPGQPPVITRVPNQPADCDNLQACYGTDGRIIFTSDRPVGGKMQLWPPRDEYLLLPINNGLWSLDPATGDLRHLIHAPSGCFRPFVDTFGRLLFVQWDHLSRDPDAVTDKPPVPANGDNWVQTNNGTGDFASEAPDATFSPGTHDTYPEPRNFDRTSLLNSNLNGNSFNNFFPWQANEDGSGHEFINHLGRHEFNRQIRPSFTDDANLLTFDAGVAPNVRTFADQFMSLSESGSAPGTFLTVDGLDVGTHGAGVINSFTAPPGANPDAITVAYVTQRPSSFLSATPLATAQDLYRTPVQCSDGLVIASHTTALRTDANNAAGGAVGSHFAFRLRSLRTQSGFLVPDTLLTTGSTVNVSWYAGGQLRTYGGALWELDPVEVVARPVPARLTSAVAGIEATTFGEEGVDIPTFRQYLVNKGYACVISRNVTRRDDADRQQPFNLKVSWSATQTAPVSGKLYDVGWLQVFQADMRRGLTMGGSAPVPGRRVLPTLLHDTLPDMPANAGAPEGAVKLGDDGSFALLVPASRGITWHLVNGTGTASQVKERYWVNFAPGEIRTCANCHGINTLDQAGAPTPTNQAAALRSLLRFWKANHPPGVMQYTRDATNTVKTVPALTLQVTRTAGTTGPVQVGYDTADIQAAAGTDYQSVTGVLQWLDGETSPKTVLIPLLGNPVIGPPRDFLVRLTHPVNGTLGSTNAVTVTLTETPFRAWLYQHFGSAANQPATGGPGADPDGDGLDNLVEYFQGTVPSGSHDASFGLIPDQATGSVFRLHYRRDRSRTDLGWQPQISDDLSQWTDIPDSAIATNGVLETRQVMVPTDANRRFVRVRIDLH